MANTSARPKGARPGCVSIACWARAASQASVSPRGKCQSSLLVVFDIDVFWKAGKCQSTVLLYLKNKNRFFLDSFVTTKTVCRGLARKMNVGFAQRDVFIDNDNNASAIKEQVLKLARKAKSAGVAVGIGHDRPVTVSVLKELIPQLEQEGYQFINLSEIINNQ